MKSASAISLLLFSLLVLLTTAGARAQQIVPGQPTLRVRSNLVEVPALVKTKRGQVVFDLTLADFSLTDNGEPQHLTLESDTDSQPLALAICVQTGGAGMRHLEDYQRLDAILESLIGNVEHRVAVIGFDSSPRLLLPFTPDTAKASDELSMLQAGDHGAAIMDGVAFSVEQLRTQPSRFRRAILLFSETIDHGSTTAPGNAMRLIGDTNTALYSFAFSSTRAAVSHEASGFRRDNEPGPSHGCFSREGADAEYDGHYSRQVLDCLSQVAPPLRLATMTFDCAQCTAYQYRLFTRATHWWRIHSIQQREGAARPVDLHVPRCAEPLCSEFQPHVSDARTARASPCYQRPSTVGAYVSHTVLGRRRR